MLYDKCTRNRSSANWTIVRPIHAHDIAEYAEFCTIDSGGSKHSNRRKSKGWDLGRDLCPHPPKISSTFCRNNAFIVQNFNLVIKCIQSIRGRDGAPLECAKDDRIKLPYPFVSYSVGDSFPKTPEGALRPVAYLGFGKGRRAWRARRARAYNGGSPVKNFHGRAKGGASHHALPKYATVCDFSSSPAKRNFRSEWRFRHLM